jgi:hypothetical protein
VPEIGERGFERQDVVEVGISTKGRRKHDRLGFRLPQGEIQIVLAVMRVERNQNGATGRDRQLHHRPLDSVLREQRHVIARFKAEFVECACQPRRQAEPLPVVQLALSLGKHEGQFVAS